MRKYLLLIFFALFSFSAIHAEIEWTLSDDGTLTISGTDMPDYEDVVINDVGLTTAPWYSQTSKIKTIVIEDGVTSIGDHAFFNCQSLTSVTIPNSVTSIGGWACGSCHSLTSVTIPNSVTNIGPCAFIDCPGLTSVTIPNSVTDIGNNAFDGCIGLTSITIPNSVTGMGDNAFDGCSYLTSIKVEEGNTKYDSRDGCNAIIEKESNTLISGCKNTVIPNSVTSIGKGAFSRCIGLTSITIPNSVTSIGDNAFDGCSGLTSITIPNSITTIGDFIISDCDGLTSITFEGSTPPEFGEEVFEGVNESIPVYVPANSIEAYKKALGDYFPETSIRALQH